MKTWRGGILGSRGPGWIGTGDTAERIARLLANALAVALRAAAKAYFMVVGGSVRVRGRGGGCVISVGTMEDGHL